MALPCEVLAGQYTVRGISLGGVQTCLHVPQFDLLFDVGACPRSLAATSRLFLTHGHADHCGGLIQLLSLRLLIGVKKPLQIYAPEYMVQPLRQAIAAYEAMQRYPYRYQLTTVAAGDEIPLAGNQVMIPFTSDHVMETLGYTVWERVKKLKPEFLELPGPEIGRRKRAGDDLFDRVERPLLSFPGDTRIGVVEQNPHLLQTHVLILEATYIDDRKTPEQCDKHGHVHLDQILERATAFQNQHLVLTHFSQSYRPREIEAIVAERTVSLTPEVHVLVPKANTWPG